MPIYPVLASFVHSNTVIDFYRGDIDESSIIESYVGDPSMGSDNGNMVVENKDSYLSINTLLDDSRDVSTENEVIDYTVQPGDSISSIAYKFQVSNNSIYWANNFTTSSTIKPGSVIKVPPVSGMIHRVKPGDTLTSVAKKYGVDEGKISEQNGLDDNGTLVLNTVLVIPGAVQKIEDQVIQRTKLLASDVKKKIAKVSSSPRNVFSKRGTYSSRYESADGEYSLSNVGDSRGFAWGNCTYFVAMHKKHVNWRGNANEWLGNAAAAGHATGSKPSPGAVIVFNGYGYNPRFGHVGIVMSVKGDSIIVKDMNYRALNEVTVRKVSRDDRAIQGYIYVD